MISLRQVTKAYPGPTGEVVVLERLDLDLDPGQFVALMGRSGSGKSTLLNLLGGIDRPSAGSVAVAGTELQTLGEVALTRWRGTTVGIVFQFFQLIPTLTALENVTLAMELVGTVPVRERRSRGLSLLEQVGVAALANRLPAALSGGEQQRVAIARALANDPPIVLADEPTGNLDVSTAAGVIALLRGLAADGRTVVVATHDPGIGELADRRLELSDGRVETVAGALA